MPAAAARRFKKGQFSTYRVIHKVHLGKFEMDLHLDDYVEYDGYTLKVGDESFNVSEVRGAIKMGWLVPEGDTTSTYTPKPADIQLRPAQAAGSNDRGPVRRVQTVDEEERVVGRVGDRAERRASAEARVDRPNAAAAPKRRMEIITEGGHEGVVAATLKTPTQSGSFDVTSTSVGRQETGAKTRLKNAASAAEHFDIRNDAARAAAAEEKALRIEEAEIESMEDDNPEALKARKKRLAKLKRARATGDVQEARSGEQLEELLPDAASAGTPRGTKTASKEDSDIDALRRLVEQGLVPESVLDAALQKKALGALDNDPDIASLRGMVESGMVPESVLTAAIEKKRAAILGAASILGSDAKIAADPAPAVEITPAPPEEAELDHTFQAGEGPELDDDDFGFEDPEVLAAREKAKAESAAEEKEAMRKAAAEALDDSKDEAPATTKDTASAVLEAKMEMARSMVPGFEWTLGIQWKSRVKKAVENHGDDPLYLSAIMAVETETVKAQIKRKLEKRKSA